MHAEGFLDSCEPKMPMPDDLQKDFQTLHNDFANLYVRWNMYREIFGTNERRTNLLNETAPSFFGTVQRVLLDDVLGGIARMTDKSASQDNLTLRRLLEELDDNTHKALKDELLKRLSQVDSACADIRIIRHKRLAHRDYKHAVAPDENPLPGISRRTVGAAMSAIADFMNSFQFPFTETQIGYENSIAGPGDATSLLSALRRAVEHRKMQIEGKVEPVGSLSSEFADPA